MTGMFDHDREIGKRSYLGSEPNSLMWPCLWVDIVKWLKYSTLINELIYAISLSPVYVWVSR